MPFPFEVAFSEVEAHLDAYVDAVFGALQSEFLTMPKGKGFVDYPVFEQGFEALKRATGNFRDLSFESVIGTILSVPLTLIVLRTMLGFTPSEWAYVASQRSKIEVSQGTVRALDRRIRMNPLRPLSASKDTMDLRLGVLVKAACELLVEGAPPAATGLMHRLDKADTMQGSRSIQAVSDLGVPYAMVLYERFLGRPFAAHRDSVSELVGDVLENAIENVLSRAGISFRKTKRAERITGFDQAPDFIVPDEFSPQLVIEAKISEDDGTARDKITRVQHLDALSRQGRHVHEPPRFEVVACISGRGFGVRSADMKKLLLATRGKVFTLQNLDRLVECTRLAEFRTR